MGTHGGKRFGFLGAALLLASGLAGCGGGGGGAASLGMASPAPAPAAITPAPDSAPAVSRFVPNYVADLDNLFHWRKTDLAVFVAPAAPASGRDLTGLATRGFSKWVEATQGQIVFRFVDAPENADVMVRFVPGGSLGGQTVGLTRTSYTGADKTIVRGDVFLDETLPDETLIEAAAHEMGHALGINGHSHNDHDTMFHALAGDVEITNRDVNTVKIAYDWAFSPSSRAQQTGATPPPGSDTIHTAEFRCPAR